MHNVLWQNIKIAKTIQKPNFARAVGSTNIGIPHYNITLMKHYIAMQVKLKKVCFIRGIKNLK